MFETIGILVVISFFIMLINNYRNNERNYKKNREQYEEWLEWKNRK